MAYVMDAVQEYSGSWQISSLRISTTPKRSRGCLSSSQTKLQGSNWVCRSGNTKRRSRSILAAPNREETVRMLLIRNHVILIGRTTCRGTKASCEGWLHIEQTSSMRTESHQVVVVGGTRSGVSCKKLKTPVDV